MVCNEFSVSVGEDILRSMGKAIIECLNVLLQEGSRRQKK